MFAVSSVCVSLALSACPLSAMWQIVLWLSAFLMLSVTLNVILLCKLCARNTVPDTEPPVDITSAVKQKKTDGVSDAVKQKKTRR